MSINVEHAEFISYQALNDYITHDQDERFLSVSATECLYYEANIDDTQYYVVKEDGSIEVLNIPADPEKKASVWERVWMGIATVTGAVVGVIACAIPGVGPVVGGAMISASLDLFMQVTISGTALDKIDWTSVLVSAVIGGVTGGIGQVGNLVTKGAIEATKSIVKQTLIKLGTSVVSGMIGGAATYFISAGIRGEEINFVDCMKAVGMGVATGAISCLGGAALEGIAKNVSGKISTQALTALTASLQIVSGSVIGAASYMLSIAITGQEFSWAQLALSAAMGGATATIMIVGNKIVSTIKTNYQKRAQNKTLTERSKESKLTDSEKNHWRSEASKQAKDNALQDILDDFDYHGLDKNNPNDREIIEFVKEHKRFPSFAKGDFIQCEFAHAIDVKEINAAYDKGIISKEQWRSYVSNPKNGILTSHNRHLYVLHDGSYKNVTDYHIAIMADPTIEDTVQEIVNNIYKGE